jgi:hypothetical protein
VAGDAAQAWQAWLEWKREVPQPLNAGSHRDETVLAVLPRSLRCVARRSRLRRTKQPGHSGWDDRKRERGRAAGAFYRLTLRYLVLVPEKAEARPRAMRAPPEMSR